VDDTEALALSEEGGNLLLQGTAGLVPAASLASLFTVFVRPRGRLADGPLTCITVPADHEGIEIGRQETFSGLKALPIHPVRFHKLHVADEYIVGTPEEAGGLLRKVRILLHALLGAISMGVARNAYEKAFSYACQRYQYGRIIAEHQEIQRMLGKMVTSLDAGTALYTQSLCGDPADGILSQGSGSHAKVFCTEAALEIVLDAVQIHGGYGYMQDYGVEKLMRDAKILQLLDGSNPRVQIEEARGALRQESMQ
jgi:alkylation response protein AidB-like acyl-CoA dehydrogenase